MPETAFTITTAHGVETVAPQFTIRTRYGTEHHNTAAEHWAGPSCPCRPLIEWPGKEGKSAPDVR